MNVVTEMKNINSGGAQQGGIVKSASSEREAFITTRGSVILTQLTSNFHNITCIFDPFLLKCIHISPYLVKKRDAYKIFPLTIKILWEPGSQVPRHYPTPVHRNHEN